MDEHPVVSLHPSPPPPRNYTSVNEGYISVADPGEGPGGGGVRSPLILDQTETIRAKSFFETAPPPPISGSG